MTQVSDKSIPALRVRGYNPNYRKALNLDASAYSNSVKSLRWWQNAAFEKLKDAKFNLMVGFCGCGKSIFQIALAVHDVVSSGFVQKQLIVVPQAHIGRGFVASEEAEHIQINISGTIYDWSLHHNFCESENKVLESLKKWLLTDSAILSRNHKNSTVITGLNAVCSHQALGLVWKSLCNSERKMAIKNLTLRVDEAHHIKGVFNPDEEGLSDPHKAYLREEATNLGKVCCFIIENGNSSKIHLTTATPYRGDRHLILSPDIVGMFESYYLDWVEHFNTLGIEEFVFEYEEYKDNPLKTLIANISEEKCKKHLIIVPSKNAKWRNTDHLDLKQLFNELYKLYPKDRVLDLVTPATQTHNKERLLKEPKNAENGESKFDVVVACMLGREGTDWCPCSRLHNTSCESSITLAIQTTGRPFRRYKGKDNVIIRNYIREFVAPDKGVTKKQLLSDRTNALLVCMQLDEMCHPIRIPRITYSEACFPEIGYTTLGEILGSQYQPVVEDLISGIENLSVKSNTTLDMIISDVLDTHNIGESRKDIHDGLRAKCIRILSEEAKEEAIDVSFIREQGFDKICEKYKPNRTIFFGSYVKDDWQNLRNILDKNNWDEMYALTKAKYEKGSDENE